MRALIDDLLDFAVAPASATPLALREGQGEGLAPPTAPSTGEGPGERSPAPGSIDADQPRPSGNLGLGLFITHPLVTDHGGHIAAVSSPARGTTFTLHLPRGPAT